MKNFSEYYANESVTPGNLYRDMNQQLAQLLDTVCQKYGIQKEEAAQIIAEYFTSKQWNISNTAQDDQNYQNQIKNKYETEVNIKTNPR